MYRILLATPVAVGLLAASAGAAEETHRFVSLGLEGLGLVAFLDEAATRVDGGEIEIAVFDADFDYKLVKQGEALPIVGAIRRYQVSCDWRAQRGPVLTSYYDSDGAPLNTRAETELQLSFYGKRASFAPAIDKVCGWDDSKPIRSFGSVKEVLTFAATVMKEPGPSPVSAPPPPPSTNHKGKAPKVMMAVPVAVERKLALPAFAEIAPNRFAAVARDEAKGHALFLDWANMKRDGDEIVALTLAVLGNEVPLSALQWRWPILALRSTRYDCKAGTVAILGEAFGYKDLSLNPQPASDVPPRPAAASPVASAALKAACGTEQGPTYSGVAEAVAFARGPQ